MRMHGELRPYFTAKIPQVFAPGRTPSPVSTPTINAIKVGKLGIEPALAAVDDQGLVGVWFLRTPKQRPIVFDNEISTWGIALNTVKRMVAVSANSHAITVYDLLSGRVQHLRGHGHNIPSIEFNPSGERLVSCSIDGSVRVWDSLTGQCLSHYEANDGFVWSCSFLDASRFLRLEEQFAAFEDSQSDTRSNSSYSPTLPYYGSSSPFYEASTVVSPTRFMQSRALGSPIDSPNLTSSCPPCSPGDDESVIIAAAASGAFLLRAREGCSQIDAQQRFDNAVPDSRPGPIVRQFDRLNMMVYCPQLSLCIIASQKGQVGLFRLLGGPGGTNLQLHREHLVPALFDVPHVPLLGLFVVMDKSSNVPYPSRAWLYLIYYDGSLMRFFIEPDLSAFPVPLCIRL
ncbi:hypothetical protein L0F63_005204 [Massospora cicadina]|nr:hypothetical protein L0F63_005204 [Massospora cicadina]